MKVAVIGRGRVGRALSRALIDGGEDVVSMGRKLRRDDLGAADVVVLAVPDGEIRGVSDRIAPELSSGATVLHCAGARSPEELEACAAKGAHVGVMHPRVSFASKQRHPSLSGKVFVAHGSGPAVAQSRRIAQACGARVVLGATTDASYHAAAALAANGAAALAFVAVGLLERLGMRRSQAASAVGGIIESVGQNVRQLGVPEALTGPVVRGDAATVRRHRKALERAGRRALSAYDAVLPLIIQTAEAAGLPRKQAAELRRIVPR